MNVSQPSNGINLVELAERFGRYFIENIAAISIVVVTIIGALVYQQIMHVQQGMDITENNTVGSVSGSGPGSKTVIVETFDNADANANANVSASSSSSSSSDSLHSKLTTGFCKSHLGKPAELETECGKLRKHSCTATSCCVWARMNSAESCVSGNQNGPIFKHDATGSPKPLDYYYFENKCKGKCPDK